MHNKMTSLFRCPLCGAPLERDASACRCPAGHSFDIAREGYVYLLPVNRRHSLAPGDDPAMAAARRAFLDTGAYAPLRDALCALALEHTPPAPVVLDSGCGEGYYTAGIYQALLRAGRTPRMAGIDISKPILRCAAKRERGVEFAVASARRLPLADGCADLLLDCFSPLETEEFRRVVRPGGTFLYVVPGPEHLWELKQVLYDRPYLNEEREIPYPGFACRTVVPVETTLHLETPADIRNLFGMTPYCWKTPGAGVARLEALTALTVRASFRIHVFRRDSGPGEKI